MFSAKKPLTAELRGACKPKRQESSLIRADISPSEGLSSPLRKFGVADG